MAYLEINGLTKRFGEVEAVSGACIQVEKGAFFTFLGPSGCGKTTTLRMIIGFETPTEGSIVMDGKDITHLRPEMKKIGMMFQNYALFPHMTVFENVAYGLKIQGLGKGEIKTRAEQYLELMGLKGYGKRKITQLSGGEQQRVALARSLATEPKILLLDEPLSNLDAKMRDEMRFELKRLQHELKITMLYVTHDQNEALMMSDQIAVFSKGKIQQTGTPLEIYNHPQNSFVAGFVGQTNLLRADLANGDALTLEGGLVLRTKAAVSGRPRFVSLRNEHILLSKKGTAPAEGARHPGTVVSRQFNGIVTYYTVRVGEVLFNVTACNNGLAPLFGEGEEVQVEIPAEAVVPLMT